jgi:glucose-1-phosphate adenylyltransferase
MKDVVCLILGGGRGSRLYPLTKHRSKPAVPIGAKYRIIDIPISNCLNNNLNKIYVLTQFLSQSLHRHINQTYQFDVFGGGFVEILAAQQTMESTNWYEGTADAVRRNMQTIRDTSIRDALILSGDQLYRMNFQQLIATHRETKADITLAVLPVARSDCHGFGIIRVSDQGRIIDFEEKPKDDTILDRLRTPAVWIDQRGIVSRGRQYLASMGIYLFKRELLVELLDKNKYADFGKHLFPEVYRKYQVQAFLFDGYWEDVGTIASYYRASLDLVSDHPVFDFRGPGGSIYTRRRFMPAARVLGAVVDHCLISDGCTIYAGASLSNSIIGVRSQIGKGVTIRDAVMIGADRYETDEEKAQNRVLGRPDLGVGDGTVIERAIIDKDCRIGRNVQIINRRGLQDHDDNSYCIRDGIVCMAKESILPDGTVI